MENKKYNMYYILFPIELHSNPSVKLVSSNGTKMMEFLENKHPNIYRKLKYGDFIENGTISGYKSNGIYIINKKKNNLYISNLTNNLTYSQDDFSVIPTKFLGFKNFVPGYQYQLKRDYRCIKSWHNFYFPLDVKFLLNQNWIPLIFLANMLQYSNFTYKNEKYIIFHLLNLEIMFKLKNIIYAKCFFRKQFDTFLSNLFLSLKIYNDIDKLAIKKKVIELTNKVDKIILINDDILPDNHLFVEENN